MTDPKAIRKAMMVAKLPSVGPAIQRLQELALAQPVQPLGIESAMRIARSAHAYGGIPMPQFGMPQTFGQFRPGGYSAFMGGPDTFAPASGYPTFQSPQLTPAPGTTPGTGGTGVTPTPGQGANEGATGGYGRRFQRHQGAPPPGNQAATAPGYTGPGSAEGNSTDMPSVSIGQGMLGPNGEPMGPGLAALGYGMATGQTPSLGFGLASLGMMGLGLPGMAVSALGNAVNGLTGANGAGGLSAGIGAIGDTDTSASIGDVGATGLSDAVGDNNGIGGIGDAAGGVDASSDSDTSAGIGDAGGMGGDAGGDSGGDSGDSGGDSGGGDSGGGDGGGGGGDGGEWRGGRQPHAKGGAVQPTESQKHAGNYRKGHVLFHGLDISIENPKGSTRSGIDATGHRWTCKQPADYGYIKRTEGADGDHVDVYLGPHRQSRQVFVINQRDHKTTRFDEHKVMLGYQSEREAMKDYHAAFSDGKGPQRMGGIEVMSLDAFKHWLKRGNTTKPAKAGDIVAKALALTNRGTRHVPLR